MSQNPSLKDLLTRHSKYIETYVPPPTMADQKAGALPPGGGATVIITCADPRVIPEEFFGFSRLRAVVVRCAGGRIVDALRSLIVVDGIFPVKTVIIVQHTDCGLTHETDNGIRKRLKERAPLHFKEIEQMKFGEIRDLEDSVKEDMLSVKDSPYLRNDMEVFGFVFNLETGKLSEIKA